MLEHVVGIGSVAQQLGNLAAQVDEPLAYFEVVFRVVVDAHLVLGHIHLPAQLTLGAVGHERTVAGLVEGEHPSLQVALLGVLGGSLAGGLGQSVELGLVGNVKRERLVLFQQVLREL